MKLNKFLCAMAAMSVMGGLVSCQNEQDVVVPDNGIGSNMSDWAKVSLKVGMPASELKTRAGETPSMTYGDDGLYNFTRTIDKLWYAVYNKGTLLYSSFDAGVPQGSYNSEDESFSLDIQIPRINDEIKLADYSVFFFAGNASDKVKSTEITDGIGLDFANKTLYAYPAILNKTTASGEMFNPEQYDYFAKYSALDKMVDEDGNGSITLTRPFCQVSLLTDELCQPAILSVYASDYKVAVNTVPSVFNKTSNKASLPYGWNFDTDVILTKDLDDLTFTLNSRAFNNAEKAYTIPQEVTFKNRQMFCVASYLMLAPDTRKVYADGSGDIFSFTLDVQGDRNTTTAYASAAIPAGGFKANEKYVLYNRKFNPDGTPGDPEDPDDDPEKPGETGILSSHYLIDIVVDPTWEGNKNTIIESANKP